MPGSSPLTPSTITYTTFGLPQTVKIPAESQLVSYSYPLDCGPYQFTWNQLKDGLTVEPIDTPVKINDPSLGTIVVETSDASKAGVYSISYTVSLFNYL